MYLFVDDVTLEELEKNNLDLFDWVCTRLDNERSGFRRDYERLAAKYKLISLEVRKSLKNEFKSEGGTPFQGADEPAASYVPQPSSSLSRKNAGRDRKK